MFEVKPDGVVEGNVKELRVAYDEYGIVSIQDSPLDALDEEWDEAKVIEVLEAAIASIRSEAEVLAKVSK